MMITINDIAQALNLSTATVSNALTGKGRVSEANRQAIIDKANEMGYDFGRLRLTPQRKTVAVFMESLAIPFCCKIAEGVSRAAEYSGYRAVLYNLDLLYENDDYNTPRERVRRKMEEILRHVDSGIIGAVYISQYPRDVTGVIPVVPFPVIYAYCYTNDGAPSVNTDDQQGAYIAVQELINRIHNYRDTPNEDVEVVSCNLLEPCFRIDPPANADTALAKYLGRGDCIPFLDMPFLGGES